MCILLLCNSFHSFLLSLKPNLKLDLKIQKLWDGMVRVKKYLCTGNNVFIPKGEMSYPFIN